MELKANIGSKPYLSAELKVADTNRASLGNKPTISAEVGSSRTQNVNLDRVTINTIISECDSTYDGSYVITPRIEAQTMATKDKHMRDDLTVNAIPRYDVTNESGGTTVSIAITLE